VHSIAAAYDSKPQRTPVSRLIAAKPAAEEMGVPYTTLRDLAFRGLIPVVRIGRAWYFDRRDLDRLIERSKETIA
jgi:excisionase family DNA binding protein